MRLHRKLILYFPIIAPDLISGSCDRSPRLCDWPTELKKGSSVHVTAFVTSRPVCALNSAEWHQQTCGDHGHGRDAATRHMNCHPCTTGDVKRVQ